MKAVVLLAAVLAYDPHILTLIYPDGRQEYVAAVDRDSCDTAVSAIRQNLWLQHDRVTASCRRGDIFDPASRYISGYNMP